jgi:hypothetical protein
MIAAAGNNNETSRLLRPQQRQHAGIGAEEDEEEDNEGMIPAALCDDRSPRHTAYHSLLVPKNVQHRHVDQDGVVAPRREESSLAASAVDDDDTKFSMGPIYTVCQQFPEILPIGPLGSMITPTSMMAAERPAETTTTAVVAPSTFYGAGDTTTIDYCIGEIGGRSSSGGGTFSPLIRRESDWAVVHHHLVGEEEMVTEAVCLPCSSWPLTMTVGVAVLAQLLVGYNIGVMNAPEPVRGMPLKMFVPD